MLRENLMKGNAFRKKLEAKMVEEMFGKDSEK